MSKESNELLSKLFARIPELEWKVKESGAFISNQNVPKGLFRFAELSGASCIAEIKADINALSQQSNDRCAAYLAERLLKKINVLVYLCQIYNRKDKAEGTICFSVNTLSTRQQWINHLEAEVSTLVEQEQAMMNTLEQLKHKPGSNVILQLKSELGEVVRRLTLAKEELNRAVS